MHNGLRANHIRFTENLVRLLNNISLHLYDMARAMKIIVPVMYIPHNTFPRKTGKLKMSCTACTQMSLCHATGSVFEKARVFTNTTSPIHLPFNDSHEKISVCGGSGSLRRG